MRCFVVMLIGLSVSPASPAWSQLAPTQPTTAPVTAAEPVLAKLFRSRLAGIEFNPPADGTLMRELNSGEVVRFAYPQTGWDVRIKQIKSHVPLQMTAPETGVLEMMAGQLTASNPTAVIIRQDVVRLKEQPVGLIEARYNVGTDPVFAQQAIFGSDPQYFLLLQMSSRGDSKTVSADQPRPLENEARAAFQKSFATVKLLDRAALFDEQVKRQYTTANLWVLFDRRKITSAIQPLHFMRILRDGKDIGFTQVNERLSTRDGKAGVEIIVRSRIENDPQTDPGKTAAVKPDAADGGVVVTMPVGPVNAQPAKPSKPTNQFTSSTFFVNFNRDHEDWSAASQTDDQVTNQTVESAYSDKSMHIDPRREKANLKHLTTQPIDIKVPVYTLDVGFERGHQQEKPIDFQLPPYYLPQALGQMLPRLLPSDPAQYMFAFYVNGERKVMSRYVDVEESREVVIDAQTARAVPISDRIGVDGSPTVHYVTRAGEWLGSINEEQKLQVLPTDEKTLTDIWSSRPPGFSVAAEPPITVDDSAPDPAAADRHIPSPVHGNLQDPPMNRR